MVIRTTYISALARVWLLAVLLFSVGCIEDKNSSVFPQTGGDGENAELSLSFSTRAEESDFDERKITSLRVVIFKSNDVGVESGAPLVNHKYEIPEGSTSVDVSEIVPVGRLNIHLVANEEADMNFDAMTSSSHTGGIALRHTGSVRTFLESPFLMHSEYRAVGIDIEGNIDHPEAVTANGKTTFPILRTAAKLTVNLNCDFENLGGRAIALDSARIVSMPAHTRLIPGVFTSTAPEDYFTSEDMWIGDMMEDKTDTSNDIIGFETAGEGFVFYIPEHIVGRTDHSRYTWLSLVGHNVGNPGSKLRYRIPLGNGLGNYEAAHLAENYDTVDASDLTINRNTNYILDLDIKGFGERDGIEVDVAVKPWGDPVDIDGSFENSYLNVSTVSTEITGFVSRRVYFWTNQSDVSVEPQGKVDGGTFTVNNVFRSLSGAGASNFHFDPATGRGRFDLAAGNSAASGRYLLYLRAGRLRRQVEVDVSIDRYRVQVSPANPTSDPIQVVSDGPWQVVTPIPNNVAVSPTSGGAGTTQLTVTRTDSTPPAAGATPLGLSSFSLRHTVSGNLVTVEVDNLHIYPETLMLSNAEAINTGTYPIFVEGGSERFTVARIEAGSWITSATVLPDGRLQIVAPQDPEQEPRTSYIYLAHADDPEYEVRFPVEQDFFTDIPPFDFFVLKFTWPTNDIDISVEFRENPDDSTLTVPPFANTATTYTRRVGWGNLAKKRINIDGSTLDYLSGATQEDVDADESLLLWGGDATGGQGETVFFKAPLVTPASPKEDTNSEWGRYLFMDAYASWYTSETTVPGLYGRPVRLSIYTYEGGDMVKVNTDHKRITSPGTYGAYPADRMKIRRYNFYNVPDGVTEADLLDVDNGWTHLNEPETIFTQQSLIMYGRPSQTNYRTLRTRVATIRYDRWRRDAQIYWNEEIKYTGDEIVPFSSDFVEGNGVTAQTEPKKEEATQ